MDKRRTGTHPQAALLLAVAISTAMVGCGGASPTESVPSGGVANNVFKIGTGEGSGFTDGSVALASTSVRAGNPVEVSVNVVNGNNELVTDQNTVTFSSNCFRADKASFSSSGTVSTQGGRATVTYTPATSGCEGTDTITAKASISGSVLNASGTVTIEPVRKLGTGSGASFVNGKVRAVSTSLTAGGSTVVSVNIVDNNGELVSDDVSVQFRSPCSAVGDATFSSDGLITTSTGLAQTTYTASGCEGPDVVTATLRLASQTLTATSTLTIAGTRQLGTGEGSSFTKGTIKTPDTNMRSGDSATLSVNVVDARGALVKDTAATVTFTSPCFVAKKTALAADSVATNTVKTVNGTASISYTPSSCEGTDTITASTIVDGVRLSAEGNVVVTAIRQMGRETGASYVNGQLAVTSGSLSAGGTTSVGVNVVDGANALTTDPLQITFNSPCLANGLARFSSNGTTTNTISTSTGTARIDYTALGCVGNDVITASTQALGSQLAATGTINVASPEIGSIDFDKAEPKDIAFSGSGTSNRPSKSTVTFKVVDKNGNGVRGKTVSFALSTAVGGITLSSATGITNSEGLVTTTLNAGSVTTTARITASVTQDNGTSIFTTSDSINVNIGIADQNSFSLSLSTFGPNTYRYDGVQVDVTARAADKNNNFVPDGTIINFVSSFGAIPGSCTTTNGSCTVKWTSQGQRPSNGMVTILARTVGEESFRDSVTNGRFDISELSSVGHLPDAFLDRDFDDVRDADEEFYDFGNDGSFTPANNLFNGSNCTTESSNAGHCASLVEVRDDARLQMASDSLSITINGGATVKAGTSFDVVIADELGNCPPTGTTVTLTVPNGGTVVGKSSYTMPNVSQCQSSRAFTFRVNASTPGGTGTVQVEVNTAGTGSNGLTYTQTANFN